MPGLEAATLNRCPTFGCPGANTELQLQTVSPKSRTAKPGNHGRQYYSCNLPNTLTPTGKCSYFRWVSVSPSFPSASPSLPGFIMPTSRERCAVSDCRKSRNKMCGAGKCRSCCEEGGGCVYHNRTDKSRSQAGTSPPAASSPTSSPVLPTSSSSALSYLSIPSIVVSPMDPALSEAIGSGPADLPSLPSELLPSVSVPQPMVPAQLQSPSTTPTSGPTTLPSPSTPTLASYHLLEPPSPLASTSRIAPASPASLSSLSSPSVTPIRKASQMPNSYHPKYDGEQERYLRKLKEEEQKKERKLREEQEVTVHCWLKDGEPPTHDSFQGESGATSKFMFSRSHLKTLGLIDNGAVQSEPTRFRIYHPEHGYWLGASEGYIALVPPGRHLFVAASGFRRLSEMDPTIARFSVKETPSHLRTGLQKERASVRAQSHSAAAVPLKRPAIAPHPSLGPVLTSRVDHRKGRPKPRPVGTAQPLQRQKRKYHDFEPDDILELSDDKPEPIVPEGVRGNRYTIDDSSDDGGSGTSARTLKVTPIQLEPEVKHEQPWKSSLLSWSPSSDSDLPGSSDLGSGSDSEAVTNQDPGKEGPRSWPRDFYCVEILVGFAVYAQQLKENVPADRAFFKAFPSAKKYSRSTFSDNRSRWSNAPVSVRDAAVDANKTDAGRWPVFARKNPIKGLEAQAALRRQAKGKGRADQ
ncbi:hypothetical protein BC835DRAFT_1309766 [Cytidiella melzeri]|nr:hypothetical protein BC835DRAFT_1309766 [Cytidiella melzeri]